MSASLVIGSTTLGGLTSVDGTTITVADGVISASGGGGNLSGDVTSVGTTTTVAAIKGVAVGTPTGTGNVVMSAGPTMSGTLTASAITCSGIFTNSLAGALSQPSVLVSGAPITGGSTTTTTPLVYFDSGGSVSSWSTSGTVLGMNAPSGFAGNFIDLHVNGGASLFSVSSNGSVIGDNLNAAGQIKSSSSGAASTAVFYATGAIYAAGNGTTTFPQWFANGSGATASTTWSTSGTVFGANIHTSVGNFLDFKIDGVTKFAVSGTGIPNFAGTNTTGAGATAVGTNCPAVTANTPYTWIQAVSADGSTVYIPAWK